MRSGVGSTEPPESGGAGFAGAGAGGGGVGSTEPPKSGGAGFAGARAGAVIFDLWDTLVPLPARLRAVAVERMAEALNVPAAHLRDAWTVTPTRGCG
jgi:hypothetical protein